MKQGVVLMKEAWPQWRRHDFMVSVATNEGGVAFGSVSDSPSKGGVALLKEVWPLN